MIGSWRMFLGVLITALALTAFGCFTNPQLNSETFGQGGATGGDVRCSSPSTCGDDNPCTTDECTNGFCTHNLLTVSPGPGSTECMTIACNNGASTTTVHNGGPCGTGLTCNAAGECVECTANGDCTVGMRPSCDTTFSCVSCSDGIQNGTETGLDCGGGTCSKCDGDSCGQGTECKSSECADGVCCNMACSGTCVACDLPGEKGACSPVPKGLEGSGCTGSDKACTGDGACASSVTGKAGTLCSMDSACYAGACNGVCRLPNFAPCAEDAECASLLCVANVCAGCSENSECTGSQCSGGRCKIPAGDVCSGDIDCAVGRCDSLAMLCGKNIGNVCSNDSQCTTHWCKDMSTCDACSVATQIADCASDKCDANGNCLLPSGAFCTTSTQCASALCKGFPSKCQ